MPSARPTKISRRPKSSGFSASAPTAAVPTLATAKPAPSDDSAGGQRGGRCRPQLAVDGAARSAAAGGVAGGRAGGADSSSAVAASAEHAGVSATQRRRGS